MDVPTTLSRNDGSNLGARMNQDENIGLSFLKVADANTIFPAIISETQVINYEQLAHIVQSFAARMRGYGVDQKSLVALNTSDVVVSLAVLMATSLLGAKLTIASKLLAKTKAFSPTHFFKSPEVQGSKDVDFVEIDETWLPDLPTEPRNEELNFEGYRSADDPWLYLHTSGSTGTPKYFALSQKMVFDRTTAIAADFPKRKTCFVSLFAYNSRPFFARAIGALLNACAIVDSQRFAFWEECGVNLVCGSPTQAAAIFEPKPLHPKSPLLEVSGAPLTDTDAKILLNSFDNLIDIYGASETNKTFANIVTLDEAGSVVKTGKPLDSQVEICNEAHEPCAPGETGVVRVKNKYSISRYLNHTETDAETFRDGWFYPGDIGMWGEKGNLLILGRNDDVFNVGGSKINAKLIDMMLCSAKGVSDAGCFLSPRPGLEHQIIAFAVCTGEVPFLNCAEDMQNLCRTRLGPLLTPTRIHQIDKIPRSEDGNIQRSACQKLLLERVSSSSNDEV